MAILSNTTPRPQPVDSRTLEQKQTIAARQLKNMAQQQYSNLCRMQKQGMKYLWENPDGLTPQEVCDSVGTDASLYMLAHGALTSCIISAAQTSGIDPDITLPTNAFTINANGTVTISDDPYVP